MKLLCAIEITENDGEFDKEFGDNILRWAGRAGYATYVFTPQANMEAAEQIIFDANFDWYLDVPTGHVIEATSHADTLAWAKANGYDLVLSLPATLRAWKNNGNMQTDEQVFLYCEAVGSARLWMEQNPKKRIKHWYNGAKMERVRK